MRVIATTGLRVSDKPQNPWLEPARLGTRCDWQPGDDLGQVVTEQEDSVSVDTKYGRAFVAKSCVRLVGSP